MNRSTGWVKHAGTGSSRPCHPGSKVLAIRGAGGGQVAAALRAEWDVLIVRKLGVPYQQERAMGAVGEDDVTVLNDAVIHGGRISAPRSADRCSELPSSEANEGSSVTARHIYRRSNRPDLTSRANALTPLTVSTGPAGFLLSRTASNVLANSTHAESLLL